MKMLLVNLPAALNFANVFFKIKTLRKLKTLKNVSKIIKRNIYAISLLSSSTVAEK